MDLPLFQVTTYELPLFPNPTDQPLVVTHPTGTLPAFAKVTGLVYSFEPKLKSHLGVYTIQGVVTNTKYSLSTSYTLKVSVTNSPPKFDGGLESISVIQNSVGETTLPSMTDKEGQGISIKAYEKGKTVLPAFVAFSKGSGKFTIKPLEVDKAQKYVITVEITDTFGAFSTSDFDITVMAYI